MKAKVLQLLRENGDYVSGQQLCEKLGVSRTAVWKAINGLRDAGYEIEALTNRGYRLVDAPTDLLTASEVASWLQTQEIGSKICYKDEIDSTNNWAKELAQKDYPSGTVCLADMQSKGKGRRGRSWESPAGSSLYFTVMLRPDILPAQASPLTLVMGLSVAQSLKKYPGLDAKIKWPNDIVVNGKKVCGILTEMSAQIDYLEYLVIGTGVNVNRMEFPEELQATATSLQIETGEKQSRARLAAEILNCFEKNYKTFLKSGDLAGLQEDYNELLVNKDREVRVLTPGNEYTGLALGINNKGELLVQKEDGSQEAVYAGEVSVRGIYGYTL